MALCGQVDEAQAVAHSAFALDPEFTIHAVKARILLEEAEGNRD